MVVPGARAVTVGSGKDWGLSLATPVIVKYRDDRTDKRTELETMDSVAREAVDLTRALVDIDSTTGREGDVRTLAGRSPATPAATPCSNSRSTAIASTSSRRSIGRA